VIERLFADGIDLAQALRPERAQVPRRLAANARSSDLAQVRVAALAALSRMRDQQKRTRRTTLVLLDDPDPEVRAQAALRCGAVDLDRLLALTEREHEPTVLVSLLGHLSSFAGPRLWPLIRDTLRSRHDDVLRAAGEAAIVTGFTDAALDIARSLELHFPGGGPETVASLVRALAVFRDSGTEPVLVRVLSHEAKDVQRLAAGALAEFGSVAAVEALLERSERLLFDRETKTALLTAVARIQARLGVVEVGRLSLAEQRDEIGALSLAEPGAEPGALSLVPSSAADAQASKANN
jgi:HEAT repeat protein